MTEKTELSSNDASILAVATSVGMPSSVGAETLLLFAKALLASHDSGEAVRMAVEAERRRCIQVCEDQSESIDLIPPDNLFQRGRMLGAWDCASAIRGEEK